MTQKERILRALQSAGARGLTTVEMVNGSLGEPILRGAARIEELRDEGYSIQTHKLKNRTARYVLVMSSQSVGGRGDVQVTEGSWVSTSVDGGLADWTSEDSFDDADLEWV